MGDSLRGQHGTRTERLRCVLVVDDDPVSAEVLAQTVRKHLHCAVHTAYDGAEAIDKACDLHPDVVLMDIRMPQIDGHETGQLFKRLFSTRQPRLIAVTGLDDEASRAATRAAGFEAHLVKPVDVSRLVELLS